MLQRSGVRSGVVLVTIAAVSGVAFAAVARTGGVMFSASEARVSSPSAYAASNSQLVNLVIKQLLTAKKGALTTEITKTIESKHGGQAIAKAMIASASNATLGIALQKVMTAPRNSSTMASAVANVINAGQTSTELSTAVGNLLSAQKNQSTLGTAFANVLAAQKNQPALDSAVAGLLATNTPQAVMQQVALGTLTASQAQATISAELDKQIATVGSVQTAVTQTVGGKIITGQVTSTGGSLPGSTVLTVPGLLHVAGIWWSSDGTVQFTVVNDSSNTLDYGGDFTGFPYGDTFASSSTEFGQLPLLSDSEGSIAPAASATFVITPAADAVDTGTQRLPYRGELHLQLTVPGSQLVTLDLSAYEIAQNSGSAGSGGSALLSGQAMVAAL